jgi:hypothetical protein
MLLPMNEVTLVHLVNEETPPELVTLLAETNRTDYMDIQMDPDPARTCQRIAVSASNKNLIIIATGVACNQLPAIALAQRATRKQILGYQLLQPTLPPFTDSWPQAPITAYFPAGFTIPKEFALRGITIEEFSNLPELAGFIENNCS